MTYSSRTRLQLRSNTLARMWVWKARRVWNCRVRPRSQKIKGIRNRSDIILTKIERNNSRLQPLRHARVAPTLYDNQVCRSMILVAYHFEIGRVWDSSSRLNSHQIKLWFVSTWIPRFCFAPVASHHRRHGDPLLLTDPAASPLHVAANTVGPRDIVVTRRDIGLDNSNREIQKDGETLKMADAPGIESSGSYCIVPTSPLYSASRQK